MLKPLFLALQQRILDAGLGIEHLDWYNDQYADQDPENRNEGDFAYPAVFLEFLPTQWQTQGKAQKARLRFRVHLVTLNYAHSRAGLPEQAQALEHLDTAALLYAALQRFRALDANGRTICNTTTRTGHTTDHNQTNQVVNIQEFETTAYDYTAVRPRTPVTPKQHIETTV
jgi:hypothetical protein